MFITKATDEEIVEESGTKDWSYASVREVEQVKPSSWFCRLVQFLEVKQRHNGSTRKAEGIVESFLYNDDLAPVESRRRVWSWKQFVFFWISGAFNVNTWQISATGLQLGLNWWQTWICVWFGYTLVAIFLVLGSLVGSNYHISFPISCRIGFGTYFSIWIVFNRLVMACVWYSTIGWLGGQCIQLMLMSLFGTDLPTRLGDHISNPHLNDFELLCFLLFWLISLPLLWFPPHSLRHVFKIKSAITPFAAFGFLIWSLVKSKGKVALGSLHEDNHVYPSQFWAVVRTLLVSLGNFATLILNAPDFSRFARSRKSCVYSQLIALPVIFSVISLTGILVTASSYTIFHINEWNPLITLGRFLNSYSSTDRALVFLIATIFCFDQLGANLANNAIPAGTDMTALLPKFINIRRGSYICACISLIICPWNLMASSDKFTKALSSYATFLSSISGVLAADYYIVRKGYVNLQHCYSNKVGTFYMYNKYGTNWRAVVAYVIGIVPNFPGFLGDLGVSVSSAAMKIFYFNYLVGYFISAAVYALLVYYFPVQGMPDNCELLDLNSWREEWQEVENFAEERVVFENDLKRGFTSSYRSIQESDATMGRQRS